MADSGDDAQPVKGKSKGKRQKAKVKSATGAPAVRSPPISRHTSRRQEHTSPMETLLIFPFCLLPFDLPFNKPRSQRSETRAIPAACRLYAPLSQSRPAA